MIHTIWKYGLIFGPSEEACWAESPVYMGDEVYVGKIDEMPDSVAWAIVEAHPKCLEYFEQAMAPLLKTYGKNRGGTEVPKFSIKSKRTKREGAFDYVLIWAILDGADQAVKESEKIQS